MAFQPANMTYLGPKLWSYYSATDTEATVAATDYFTRFLNARPFEVGDAIILTLAADPQQSRTAVVTSLASAGHATIDGGGAQGKVGTCPSVTGLSCKIVGLGGPIYRIDWTLTAMSMAVTDAGGSGSSASQKIFDFAEGLIEVLGSIQNYTAFAEGAALTTGAGDAAFIMALGTVAANAGDGALTGTEVDIAAATNTMTNSGGTTTGSKLAGGSVSTQFDGTATAIDCFLNWSGTAATIDANSTIAVTGTISLTVAMLGDK